MSFEKYFNFFEDYENGVTIRPKRSAEFKFSQKVKDDKKYRLFVTGQTANFYLWKNEPDTPYLYRLIDDALDTENAKNDQYCLDLSCKDFFDYTKRAYKKVLWQPILSYLKMENLPTLWQFGIWVKAENLEISENGFLRFKIDIRYKKENVSRHSIHSAPDKTVVIDIPEGTYDWQKFFKDVEIPLDCANVGVFIEGKGYKGKVFVEHPFLSGERQNLLPSFSLNVAGKENFQWTSQFLSRKEWPEFQVELNGKKVFEGEIFERCHTASEWEIDLPKSLIKEENTVEITLISDYHDPLPYTFFELGIIEQPDATVSVISENIIGASGGKARVLLHTNTPDTLLKIEYLSDNISGESQYFFKEAGYHGISIDCKQPCENAIFKIISGETEIQCKVERIVIKENDNVIVGTGDLVYINQNLSDMMEYLAWYVSNNVGNFLTIRPVYRWSGSRTLNRDCWGPFTKVLNEMGIKYVLLKDGRELPGISANPDDELIKGEGYLGSQNHEIDGRVFYWGQKTVVGLAEEQWNDLCQIAYKEDPIHTKNEFKPTSYINEGETFYRYTNKNYEHNLALGEEYNVKRMREDLTGETRHTGPSVLFKAFKEAGYKWVGAETMYSSIELQLAFLRGFCKANDMDKCGVHNAVQWSSTPYKSIEHYDRYRLALYLPYMLGVTDINTEEGLWHMEEYYLHPNRFKEACLGHLKQEQDVYKYILTHSRTGEFYTPFAFINGKHDGTVMFCPDNMWGWNGTPQTLAEESWKSLFKVIYPLSKPQYPLYYHCIDNCKESLGYYSGTPLGNTDVIPMENDISSSYKLVIFAGYNMCGEDEAKRLYQYVEKGGTVILTRAHLTSTTDYEKIRISDMEFVDHLFAFSKNAQFITDTKNGIELPLCNNPLEPDRILETTDSGLPLVCEYEIGKGKVILFNTKVYPAHQGIKDIYENTVKNEIIKATEKEEVWAKTGNDVGFSVYKQPDGSTHIYFLAVDWYNGRNGIRNAELILGSRSYDVEIPFGVMIKAVANKKLAVFPKTENGEVIKINNNTALVQGTGKVPFVVLKDGETRNVTVDFSQGSIIEIQL